MVCQGEYTGKIPNLNSNTQDGSECLCQLSVQFETYNKDVYYSIRDSRVMGMLGFSTKMESSDTQGAKEINENKDMVLINKILTRDPTNLDLSDQERKIIVK